MPWSPDELAARIASELSPGDVVSLGAGLPMLVVGAVDDSMEIMLHGESGILGMGPKPRRGNAPRDAVDVEGQPVGVMRGGAFFDIAQSSVMARGGHFDVCVLGALEVDERGNLVIVRPDGSTVTVVGGEVTLQV